MHLLRIVVHGRVQGVGFRYFVQRRAEDLALSGEVRNRPDGALEVIAEGPRESLEALLAEVRRGPGAARVTEVEVEWGESRARARGFRITG